MSEEFCYNQLIVNCFLLRFTGPSRDGGKERIIYENGGARRVMVIVVENGHNDTSSNPGRD